MQIYPIAQAKIEIQIIINTTMLQKSNILYPPCCKYYICDMELIFDLHELSTAAKSFWKQYPGRRVFAFRGQMGAGKTTFITALCRELGVSSVISSPTFSIINEYDSSSGPVYHIDLYRLKDDSEAMQAGVEEVLYSGNICLVEWPDRAQSIFPEDTLWLEIELVDRNKRKLSESVSYNAQQL